MMLHMTATLADIFFKPTSFLSDRLLLSDTWRSSQSRIDLRLLSSQGLQLTSDVTHSHAPLSAHKMVKLKGSKEKSNIRGYWKLNNDILDDKNFQESVKLLANNISTKRN